MGCGGSKCDPQAEALPARIRPLLLRRFDEMRGRSRNVVSSSSNSLSANLSQKELLKEAVLGDLDDISAHPHQQGNVNKLQDSNADQSLEKKQKEANEDDVLVNVENDDKAAKEKDEEEEEEEEEEEKEAQTPPKSPESEPDMRMLKQRSSNHLKVDTSFVGNRFTDDSLYPGSPSFRFYFIDSLTDKDEDGEHSDKEDDIEKKSLTKQSSSVDVDSVKSDSAIKIKKKKSRRVHRLRNVIIPKGSTGAVKNLLNVRSCYKPSRGRHQDDAILLGQKTPHSV